ncbi:glycosyltransferase family 39 protein [Desulfonatronum sp. SC1]|uniref:ArnT family glycosyltransferase n=1 Tax=Desulfonatronum sp. SC1 TaxID=2109626 RepID=UPI000D2F4E05|nr:glycosyltransferase family 39 protein [Desulfonatronum sp. SC1]PTN36487.1 hypothetical protein C6366_09190 [Desulfonatronum sp. SC1]
MLQPESNQPEKRCWIYYLALPCFLLLLAFFLRTSGLSHDLHFGSIYHPDTPKQIRAVERFLDDRFSRQYYRVWHNPDLDGYPYFNSHLVEHIYRGYAAARNALLWHVGVPPEPFVPDTLSIFWTTRIFNSLLSSLAVVTIFFMAGKYFGLAAGLFAGLLLAFSPVDITVSNYAMSDSTAAFFALLAVFFALRVIDSPRLVFYLAGTLSAAFAFSAKYHAGAALLPIGLAHLLAYPTPKSWLTWQFLARSLLMLVFFVLGVLISTPSLLVYPSGAFQDLLNFMAYTSGFGMTQEMRELPVWSRFILAMRMNLPLLADYIGWIPLMMSASAMIAFRNHKHFWVILSLPLFFILVGLTAKPLSHPDYFTVIIPMLLLACAAVLHLLWTSETKKYLTRLSCLGLFCASLFYLGNYAWHEVFFFRHTDTRRVAETWALDTLPREFQLHAGPYTFAPGPWTHSEEPLEYTAFVRSDRTSEDPPGKTLLHEVIFEKGKLSRVRNMDIRFLVPPDNSIMQPWFTMPVMNRYPASRRDTMVQAQVPHLARCTKTWELSHGETATAVVVSDEPLLHSVIFLRNDESPADVSVRFGGITRHVILQPHETVALRFDSPRAIPLSRSLRHFYRIKVESRFNLNPIQVVLATSEREIAREFYLAGEYQAAFVSFDRLDQPTLNLSEKFAMALSGLASGALTTSEASRTIGFESRKSALSGLTRILGEMDETWFFKEFGIDPMVATQMSPVAVNPLEVVTKQLLLLRGLIASQPEVQNAFVSSWAIFFHRGRVLEESGEIEQALQMYKAAHRLAPRRIEPFKALDRIAGRIPDKDEELRQILEPYRLFRDMPSLPVNIRFTNGIGIDAIQVNSLDPKIGQHFELLLSWSVPHLRPSLYMLEYVVEITHMDEDITVQRERRHFVKTVLEQREGTHPPHRLLFNFNENHPPGRYSVRLSLQIPAQDRSIGIRRPRHARGDKAVELTRLVLTIP